MGDIMLPRPDNVRGRFGSYVTHDLFHIAERLQEISPRLYIQTLDPPVQQFGKTYNFAVCEVLPDGRDTLVYRVQELDARVLEHVQYLLKVPFEKRFKEAEAMNDKWEAEKHEEALDELAEKMAGPMHYNLERCNFIDPWGPKYAPMNRAARRHRNRRAGVPA